MVGGHVGRPFPRAEARTRSISAAVGREGRECAPSCLHEHKIDPIAHLCPAPAAGLGALLGPEQDTIHQAVQEAVHGSVTFRQSRKGEIFSWSTFAPAHSGKMAVRR